MKFKLSLLIIFVPLIWVNGQNSYDLILKKRISDFSSVKSINFEKENIDLFNYFKKNDLESLRKYIDIVFISKKDYKTANILQWNSHIKIYLDKNIPKKTRKTIKRFYSSDSFKEIENLKISFVNKKSKSNYWIKDISSDSNSISSCSLIKDENFKVYGCILKVKCDDFDNKRLSKILKQSIFRSLGNFSIISAKRNYSLLSINYTDQDILSDFDLNILKLHYNVIYDQIVNLNTFNKILSIDSK